MSETRWTDSQSYGVLCASVPLSLSQSGLMCVAYHPKNPSLVAAGSFNGEVFVWDTEPDEYKFYSSGIGDYFHREPVTNVAWVYDVQAAEYNVRLATSCIDLIEA